MVGAKLVAICAARAAATRAVSPAAVRHHGHAPAATVAAHRVTVRQLVVVAGPCRAHTWVRTTVVGCPTSAHSASARQIAARP